MIFGIYDYYESPGLIPYFWGDTTAIFIPRKHHYNANNKRKKRKGK